MVVRLRPMRGARELVEEITDVRRQLLVRREETEIRVEASRHRVIVARSHVHVAAKTPILAAGDERQLRVILQSDEPVHDVDAGVGQTLRPRDVALLIESRLQLHECDDFLAGTRGAQERVDDRRTLAGSIQRHLDRRYVIVIRRFVEKSLN